MTAPHHRIQVQLDEERHALLVAEAERTGRSVPAVIRECIDVTFDEFRRERLKAELRVQHFAEGDASEPHRHADDHHDDEILSRFSDA